MRGISAAGIGLLLIFYPEKSGEFLGNMMGFFWLVSGFALLRRIDLPADLADTVEMMK